MATAAATAGVSIVTGDTKVVQKGKADGCFINTTGIGVIERDLRLGATLVKPGDAVIVSGPIGDHGVTIMLARGELDLVSDIASDTAPLTSLVDRLCDATTAVGCLRDATRGGVATILNEVARAARVAVVIDERAIPVRDEVRGACEILGIDPLYVACEGRIVAIVDGAAAETALQAMRSHRWEKVLRSSARSKMTRPILCSSRHSSEERALLTPWLEIPCHASVDLKAREQMQTSKGAISIIHGYS